MRVLFTVLLVVFLFTQSYSQKMIGWLAAGAVASKVHGNLHPRIQLDKYNNPIVVWGDDGGKVWMAKWGGESFSNPEQINIPGTQAFATSWSGPDIATHGDTVYVVYKNMPTDKGHLYITHSYDGGVHFSVPDQIDQAGDGTAHFPVVTTDETGNPFVAFMRTLNGNEGSRYVVTRSDDLGESFKPEVPGSLINGGSACECSPAAISVSGNAGILLYRNNLSGLRNIYASLSTEGCQRFNYGMQMDSTDFVPANCPASGPDGVITGDHFYGVYTGGKADNTTVYLAHMSLSSRKLSVFPISDSTNGIVMQNFPRIAAVGTAAAAVWTQTAGGNNQVCLSFTGDISYGFPDKFDTVADGVMINADVAVGGGFIYVVWEDYVTRSVMYRRGVYTHKKGGAENTSILITSPPQGQKFFWVNQEGVLSCTLIDEKGSSYEMELSYPKGNTFCKVDTDDMEPGNYTVKVWDSEGRTFTGRVELK